jgi:hypothetical protein
MVGDYTYVTHGEKYQGGWACSKTPAIPSNSAADIIKFEQFSGINELVIESNNINIEISYPNGQKQYNLEVNPDNVNILLDAGNTYINGVVGLTGEKSLMNMFKYIDNNFKVLFQNLDIDGYDYQHFFAVPAVDNTNPSTTSQTSSGI